ncbi:hypothetical protein K8O68_11740 [Salipaludibacillus sp. CUR1]|uniref:hypothetical protein n=1 Tax=Salipaludibacillus sp. CUR1 TaxID=2820003 RepID=UPI001E587BF7|nr:hypothetical protein [Salipaludibacillus sp. CUR1]MCE7793091.1 hypothetical protein [Salipaludibacillus sp. CUR1]
MSLFISFLFTTLLILYLSTFFINQKNSPMKEMVITMAIAMAAGLCIGAVTGILFHGLLFQSTVFSVAAASVAGLLIGWRFHFLAAVEGFFSGLMAAMMMAMVADMVTLKEAYNLLFLSSMLLISVIVFSFILLNNLSKRKLVNVYLGAIGWILAAFIMLAPVNPADHAPQEEKHRHTSITSVFCTEAG